MCYQTLVAVTQAIAQEREAIAQDELEITKKLQAIKGRQPSAEEPKEIKDLRAIVKGRSRHCKVRISTFVEQRLPLGFLGLECLQMGSMTIAHLHQIHFVLTEI